MDKKLLNALNNLSFALETMSDILSKKSDKKSDTAKALSSADLSKQFEQLNKSIKEGIESNKSQSKNAPKDVGFGNLSKKINEIGNSVKNLLSSSKQILSMQKSIGETKPEVIVSVEKMKVPPMKPIEIPLRYGKLEPLKLPIPKPIDLTFSKLKSPTLPEIKAAQIPLNYGKLPKSPILPSLKSTVDFVVSKLPKLPTVPQIKSSIDFAVSKLPKLPTVPQIKSSIDFAVSKLPKLPKVPSLKSTVDFAVSKLPKLPTISNIKSSIDFTISKIPKLPTVPQIKSSIDFAVSKLPKLPKVPSLKSSIDFAVSKLPKLPTVPQIKSSIDFVTSKLPKLPKVPSLKSTVDFAVSKLPKLPKIPSLKSSIDFVTSKLPKLPKVPSLKSTVDFAVSKLPKLPKVPSLKSTVDFAVSKLPKLPKVPSLKSSIDFVTPKLPKLPKVPNLKSSIDFVTSKLPKLPKVPSLKSSIDFAVSKLPKLPTPKPVEVEVKYKEKKAPVRTIEKQGKEENDGGLFGKSGDPKAKKNIKDGVTMIILIAAGVLAIGLAFKIVGGVNFASVIAISAAISLLAVAFSKLAEQKSLTPGRAIGLTAVLVGISLAVMLSSFILAAVKPVGLLQLFTAIMIAGMFTVISYGLGKLLSGMGEITGKSLLMIPLLPFIMVGISMAIAASSLILGMVKPVGLFQAITAILIAGMFAVVSYGLGQLLTGLGKLNTKSILFIPLLPLILIAISAAIVGSSYLLGAVKPIGLFQAITAIFIAAVFAAISFGLGKLLKGFEGISGTKAIVIAAILPILMIAISAAILGSSFLLAGVKPIGLFQALTAVMIGIIFIPISFAIPFITKGIANVSPAKMALVPIIMVAMALTIMLSSYILAEVKVVPFSKLMSALGTSIVLAAIGLGMGFVLNRLSKFKQKDMKDGGINLAIIAASVVVSSLILSLGKYDKYPTFSWIFNVGISMVGFGYAIYTLNKIGLKTSDIIKGGISVIAIATTVYLTSLILSKGTYDKYPSLTWDFYTAVAMVAFGYAIYTLNKIGLKLTDVIKGGISVIAIAGTIMATSHILAKGDYSITPPIEWVMKSAVGLVIFGTAIYVINKFAKPTDIIKGAISVLLIAGTIMATSHILALGDYSKSPPLDWTLNVAASMIPFGIAAVLLGTIASSGIGAIAIAAGLVAILAVAGTIVATDAILAMGDYSKSPPLDWTLNVAASMVPFGAAAVALGTIAISGVGAVAIAAGLIAILAVAKTVVETDAILATGNYSKYPSLDWSKSVSLTMAAFATGMTVLGGIIVASFGLGAVALAAGSEAVLGVAQTIVDASIILAKGNYTGGPTEKWAKGVALSLGAFSGVYTMLAKNAIFSLFGGGGIGPKEFGESIITIADSINIAAEKLSTGNFTGGPKKEWAEGISLALGGFAPIYAMLQAEKIMSIFGKGVSVDSFTEAIVTISKGIKTAATELQGTKVYENGPKKEWAEGVSLALGGFAPVYAMLQAEKIMSIFGKGVSVDSFTEAIVTISKGIKTAADELAKGKTSYVDGPTKTWAEGVSIALGGFAPVYAMLQAEKIMDIFGKGVSVDSFTGAIVAISKGIKTAADELAKGKTSYVDGPTKTWAEGVSIALQAFTGIFQALNANSGWFSGKLEPEDYKKAIKATGEGLVEAAKAIGGEGVVYDVTKVPDKVWGESITGAFMAFIPALKYINDQSGWFSSGAEDTVTNMAAIALAIKDASITLALGNYTTKIDPNWSNGIKLAVDNFLGILKTMSEQDFDYDDEYEHLTSTSNALVLVSIILSIGKYVEIPKTYLPSLSSNITSFVNLLTFIGKSDIDLVKLDQVKQLSTSIKDVSIVLAEGNFSKMIPKPWMDSVRTNLMSFSQMVKSFDSGGFLSMFSDSTSEKVTELANGIIELAKILNENKVPFDTKKVPSIQWSQGFSTAMTSIMPGLNYISENSGFLTSGEDKFKSGVSAIADALVSVSRKLALGKFDRIINPDYFKNLSQNINSYINIIKSVEESDADYDSVSDMADSMVELAKAYDKLGTAIQGLNGQLGGVDLEKMTMLKNLTGSVVMLSLMDSAQFESMMDALESKAKILLDVVKDTEESTAKQAASTPPAAGGAKGGGGGGAKVNTTPVKRAAPKESESDKMMKELGSSLAGLQSAVSQIAGVIAGGGGVSLKTYMESKMKTEKKPLGK